MDGASARLHLVEIRTLALRVNAKLGTLSLTEGILLLRVHDEQGGSQQALQRRLGCILLEGLFQIVLEHSVGAILARVMKVGVNLLRNSASKSAGMSPKSARAEMSCSENCSRVSAMLFWSTVMVVLGDLYKLYHLS